MAALLTLLLIGASGVVASISGDAVLPDDHCSFLQNRLDVHSGSLLNEKDPPPDQAHRRPWAGPHAASPSAHAGPHRHLASRASSKPPAAPDAPPPEARTRDVHPPPAALTQWHMHQEAAPVDPGVVLVKMLDAFTDGKFRGDDCKENAASLFTPDAVIDVRGPKDTDYFKMYPEGLDGVCEYFKKRYAYDFIDVKANTYHKGNRLVQVMTYIPAYIGANEKASGYITEYLVHRFNEDNTLLSGFDAFYDLPSRYDELRGNRSLGEPESPQAKVVNKVFADLEMGKLTGAQCTRNAAALFAPNAVLDLEMPTKDKDFFKLYNSGLGGVCEFLNKTKTEYVPSDMQSNMYMRGDELIQFFNYVPRLHGRSSKDAVASDRVQQYHVWWFSPEMKILGIDSFCDRPELFDEIHDKDLSAWQAEVDGRARQAKEEATALLEAENMKKVATDKFAEEVATDIYKKEEHKKESINAITNKANTIMNVSRAFAEGRLKGKACAKAAHGLFTVDAVIDSRGPRDTDFFKKYQPGLNGICEHFNKSYAYGLHDLKASMYQKGDAMVHVLNYIPGYAGETKLASGRVTQYDVIKFSADNSKIARIETIFHKPWIFDELKGDGNATPPAFPKQVQLVNDVLAASAAGFFKGSECVMSATFLFTFDAVVDLQGPQTKNKDVFKQYKPGPLGVCEYFYKVPKVVEFHDLKMSMYPRGDDVVQFLNYVPGQPGSEQEKSERVLQYFVWTFNKDKSLIRGVTSFWDKPVLLDTVLEEVDTKSKVKHMVRQMVGGDAEGGSENAQLTDLGAVQSTIVLERQKHEKTEQIEASEAHLEKRKVDTTKQMEAAADELLKKESQLTAKQMKAAIDVLEEKKDKMKEQLAILGNGEQGEFGCKEGDRSPAFHEHRACGNFNAAELDIPMTRWPYLTRWCKLAHRSPTVRLHQCYAQQCLASKSPTLAAKVWFQTKPRDATEVKFCKASGFCDDRTLSHNSTLGDMEFFCNKRYGKKWKKYTPRDAIKLLQEGVGDNVMHSCASGTAHCDAARCQRYFCNETPEPVAPPVKLKMPTPIQMEELDFW